MAFDSLKSKVSQTKDKLTEQASDQLTKVSEASGKLADIGHEKIRGAVEASLNELNGLAPLLQNCGFIIGDVSLTASIPPALGIVIEQEVEGSGQLDEALERDDLSRTQSIVLKSIKRVYDLNDLVEKYDHTVGQVEIELSVPPTVRAHLNSKKSRSFTS